MVPMEIVKKKKNKKGKKSKIISFDEETVTQDYAQKLIEENDKTEKRKHKKEKKLATQEKDDIQKDIDQCAEAIKSRGQKKNKRKKEEAEKGETNSKPKKKKKNEKKTKKESQDNVLEEEEEALEEGLEDLEGGSKPTIEKPLSIRAMKRQKHEDLQKNKKLKHELDLQQKSLNYLSKWKHSRTEWKFEKLKQIWLQQNMFDTARVPDEFWDTLVDYLSGSKGQIRKVLIKSALDIIEKKELKGNDENGEDTEETDKKLDDLNILKRARDIIQHLEE